MLWAGTPRLRARASVAFPRAERGSCSRSRSAHRKPGDAEVDIPAPEGSPCSAGAEKGLVKENRHRPRQHQQCAERHGIAETVEQPPARSPRSKASPPLRQSQRCSSPVGRSDLTHGRTRILLLPLLRFLRFRHPPAEYAGSPPRDRQAGRGGGSPAKTYGVMRVAVMVPLMTIGGPTVELASVTLLPS